MLKTHWGTDQLKFMLETHLAPTVHWDGLSILKQQVVVSHPALCLEWEQRALICMQIASFKDSSCSE